MLPPSPAPVSAASGRKAPQPKDPAHVVGEPERIKHRQKVQQTLIMRIVEPPFDRYPVCCVAESASSSN